MKKLLKLLALVSLVSFQANADDIYLGDVNAGGTGCPQDTYSVTLSPDQKSLSVLFDNYVVEAGAGVGKRIDRKTCNLAVGVHVPQGFSVSIIKADYRGFVSIPRGGRGQFSVEYFFAGQRGPRVSKTFSGGFNDEYFLSNNLVATASVWSACGADVNLRINTSMLAQTNRGYEDALATVDSVDVNAGLVYHLQWRRCR